MKYLILYVSFISLFQFSAKAQNKKIILEYQLDNETGIRDYNVQIRDLYEVDISLTSVTYPFYYDRGVLKWHMVSDTPVVLLNSSNVPFFHITCPLEPGDSIRVKKVNEELFFSGKGAEKFELRHKINNTIDRKLFNSLTRSSALFRLDSLNGFFDYIKSMDKIWDQELSLINEYRQKLSHLSFLYFKAHYLNLIQDCVGAKFSTLTSKRDSLGLTVNDLRIIYDSTLQKYEPTGDSRSDSANLAIVTYGLMKLAEVKSNLKAVEMGALWDDMDRRIARYYYAKEMYSGLAQRKVLSYLVKYILRKHLEPRAIAVAKDFLSLDGYPRYNKYVQNYMNKQLGFESGKPAPSFELNTTNGKVVSLKDLKGKIVFMDFWFTGCTGCVQIAASLKHIEKMYKNNSQVEFLSVSVDANRSQWLNSITRAKYTTGSGTNVYTGGKGRDHSMIADYNVTAYPTVFLIDADGKFVRPVPDPRRDNGRALKRLIDKLLPPSPIDGPYILYKSGKTIVKAVDVNDSNDPIVEESELKAKGSYPLQVSTDVVGKTFNIKIKDSLKAEPAVFEQPSKALVVSDIEGEFTAFGNLLQANKVVDENFNWTFDNGHLICIGDFFDRGRQVTEVLWLIYSLEEKAKAQGGYVHFILGNHEIMNLAGDIRYVNRKYTDNAKLLNEDYVTGLFGENSELGRWLRTKNIMEKIGNTLYVHAGISSEINSLELSLTEIDNLARLQYGKKTTSAGSKALQTIMDTEIGPFWYRGYYKNTSSDEIQIDSTLQKFDVNRIVTGHTIMADTINIHYNGKVINTDTHHAEGKSEALLMEDDRFYRVNDRGERKLLFIDDKRNR